MRERKVSATTTMGTSSSFRGIAGSGSSGGHRVMDVVFLLATVVLIMTLIRPLPQSVDDELRTTTTTMYAESPLQQQEQQQQNEALVTKTPLQQEQNSSSLSTAVPRSEQTTVKKIITTSSSSTNGDDNEQEQQQTEEEEEEEENSFVNKVNIVRLVKFFSNFQTNPVLRYLESELSDNTETFTIQDSKLYQQANCILDDGQEWCPSNTSDDEWLTRTPGFLIIGAKKAGTTSFFSSITQFSGIIGGKAKELLFFTQKKFNFDEYTTLIDADYAAMHMHEHKDTPKLTAYANASAFRVHVTPARRGLVQLFHRGKLQRNPRLVSLDATPEYLFNFPTSIKSIMCICPWIKILIILRHPTDRVWSHYNFLQQAQARRGAEPMRLSFEEFVLMDAGLLDELGLSSGDRSEDDGDSEQQNGRAILSEEDIVKAWFNYKQSIPEGPLGRSMYALQIHQWFKELRRIGRDPRNSVKIVRLEDLKRGGPWASKILNELADWVRPDSNSTTVTNTTADYSEAFRHAMITNYTKLGSPVLSDETRAALDKFYAPHNEMLSLLLGDDRWMYDRNDAVERPLVWPMNKDANDETLFARTTEDELGPCASNR